MFFKRNCICCYHVYKKVWAATVEEALMCKKEPKISSDRYAVAVKNEGTITENLPRKLSRVCSLFFDEEVHSRKCECRVQAHGLVWSIIHIVTIRCRKNSLSKIFHVVNFRSLMQLRKFFSNKNFPIYGYIHPLCPDLILQVEKWSSELR